MDVHIWRKEKKTEEHLSTYSHNCDTSSKQKCCGKKKLLSASFPSRTRSQCPKRPPLLSQVAPRVNRTVIGLWRVDNSSSIAAVGP